MRRRSRAGGERAKSQRRKTTLPERRNASKAVRRRSSSVAGKEAKVALFKRERDEALEREKASAEVLRIISTSPGELKPIFQAMLENAVRICEAVFGNLYLRDADGFHMVAAHHDSPAYVAARMSDPLLRPPPDAPLGRLAITKEVVQIADIRTLPSRDHPCVAAGVKAGYRTVLAIPLLKDDELIGAFTLIRHKVQAFTEKQIALLQNFAAQAVIAIENTRLLNELRQRTTDLTESLEQQTATSKVLEVISSSPGDLKPVFEAILANAVRLCGAKFGNLYLREGDGLRAAAMHNAPPAYAEQRAGILHFSPNTTTYRATQTKQPAQIADMTKSRAYLEGDPWFISAVSLGGHRGALSVPMLHEDEPIGVVTILRQEAGAFADKQIELLTNFAAQAVIAIENARLLNELQQRTTDLTESLEQQTATSEVLGVISRSPGELEPVFQAMLENAVRICEAKFGHIYRWNGAVLSLAATHNTPPAYEALRRAQHRPSSRSAVGRVVTPKTIVHVVDMTVEEAYKERDPGIVEAVELAGMRTSQRVVRTADCDIGSPQRNQSVAGRIGACLSDYPGEGSTHL